MKKELKNYVLPVIIIGAALTAYFGDLGLRIVSIYLAIGLLAFSVREAGQRVIAQWMDAYVDTEISVNGSLLTLSVAFISSVTAISIALIIPVVNSYRVESHEHWGKSVDAMWSKRQYWIALGGIIALTTFSTVALSLGSTTMAQGLLVFTLSQMVPLRDIVIEGSTDGTFILFHSGITWLIVTGLNIMLLTFAAF